MLLLLSWIYHQRRRRLRHRHLENFSQKFRHHFDWCLLRFPSLRWLCVKISIWFPGIAWLLVGERPAIIAPPESEWYHGRLDRYSAESRLRGSKEQGSYLGK